MRSYPRIDARVARALPWLAALTVLTLLGVTRAAPERSGEGDGESGAAREAAHFPGCGEAGHDAGPVRDTGPIQVAGPVVQDAGTVQGYDPVQDCPAGLLERGARQRDDASRRPGSDRFPHHDRRG